LARGTSDNAGHYLKFLIEVKLGLPVGLASPSSVSIYGAKVDFKNTLVIALSQSGRSPDLITFSSAAREGGALLIAMTNNSDSPLAKAGDIHIDLSAGPEVAVAATKSYSAELLASLLLVDSWMGNKEEARAHLVDSSRECIANLSQVDSFANSLDAAREIVVIGRGYSYANAKELALKIQETSHIPVQGMSSADYQHGPIATLNKNSQVIVLSPSGMPKKALEDSIARIRQSGPELIWLGSNQLAPRRSPSGAPPDIAASTLPPRAWRIFEKTNLSKSACLAFRPRGTLPSSCALLYSIAMAAAFLNIEPLPAASAFASALL